MQTKGAIANSLILAPNENLWAHVCFFVLEVLFAASFLLFNLCEVRHKKRWNISYAAHLERGNDLVVYCQGRGWWGLVA